MQYYEYLNIDYTNYQNIIHVAQSGDCFFNIGIWGDQQGHELDGSIEMSLDGNVWADYSSFSINPPETDFRSLSIMIKMIRIIPYDNTILNFSISEYYRPINLMMVGS